MNSTAKYTPFTNIPSPCIGVCSSTALGDNVCRGCKRFSHEVIQWNGFTEAQKRLVDQRLQDFLAQVMAGYFETIDVAVMDAKIAAHKVRIAAHKGEASRAYDLLRAGGVLISDFSEFGLQLKSQYRHLNTVELLQEIDQKFWTLSSAYYERYYVVAGLGVSVGSERGRDQSQNTEEGR